MSTPRENSERSANRAPARLAVIARAKCPAAGARLPFAARLRESLPGARRVERALTTREELIWASESGPPAFSSPALRPSVRAHLCFHYPRAYLTTTARPHTGPNAFFLSYIIKTPYKPYRFSTRRCGCPAQARLSDQSLLLSPSTCLCRISRSSWRLGAPLSGRRGTVAVDGR